MNQRFVLLTAFGATVLILFLINFAMRDLPSNDKKENDKFALPPNFDRESYVLEQRKKNSFYHFLKEQREDDANQEHLASLELEKIIRDDDKALLNSNLPRSAENDNDNAKSLLDVSHSNCEDAKSCLECLFRTSVENIINGCTWLPAREQCVSSIYAKNQLPGADSETQACPAILHSSSPSKKSLLVPANLNVIHVAIRKGGPEALIQLHLALVYWGFNTNLDSRKSKKQKGGPVVPFFKEMYSKEFARVGAGGHKHQAFRSNFQDYESWQKSGNEGDVLIATETWKCRNDRVTLEGFPRLSEPIELRKSGVRYAQWHLTVWPRKPRPSCTILVHTRYIGEVFMRAPLLSLLFPYVSPHIVRLSDQMIAEGEKAAAQEIITDKTNQKPPKGMEIFEMKKKSDNEFGLLMYDGDMKTPNGNDFFKSKGQTNFLIKKATGFTPQALYEEYSKASVCIDWELPGGERFIYESALFGCCSIVDRSLNGLDKEDFPLPDSLRVFPSSSTQALGTPLLVGDDYLVGTAYQQSLRKQDELEQQKSEKRRRKLFQHALSKVEGKAGRIDDDGGAPEDDDEEADHAKKSDTKAMTLSATPTLNQAIAKCTNPQLRKQTMQSLEPLRLSILKQRVRFHRHVRRYFSNNIHIVSYVATEAEFKKFVPQFILTTLIAIPFATIEIVLTASAAEASEDIKSQLKLLLDHSYLSAVLWTISGKTTKNSAEQSSSSFLKPSNFIASTSANRVGSVAFVPIDHVVSNRNFVHYLTSLSSILTTGTKTTIIVSPGRFVFFSNAKLFEVERKSSTTIRKQTIPQVVQCKFDGVSDCQNNEDDHIAVFTLEEASAKAIKSASKILKENDLIWKSSLLMDQEKTEGNTQEEKSKQRNKKKNTVSDKKSAQLLLFETETAKNEPWKKFLCRHAVYQMLFPDRC